MRNRESSDEVMQSFRYNTPSGANRDDTVIIAEMNVCLTLYKISSNQIIHQVSMLQRLFKNLSFMSDKIYNKIPTA